MRASLPFFSVWGRLSAPAPSASGSWYCCASLYSCPQTPASFGPYFPTWRKTLSPLLPLHTSFAEAPLFFSKCHSDCQSCSKEMRLVMRLAEGFNASVSLSSLALTSSFSLAHQKLIPVSACNIRPFSGSSLRSVALNSAWGSLQLRADTKTEKWWTRHGFLTRSRATESHQCSLKLSWYVLTETQSVKYAQSRHHTAFVLAGAGRPQLHV